jgi:hypothetical protein
MLLINDKVIETGRSYGMEMNVEKTKVMRISRQLFYSKTYDRPKTTRMWNLLNILVAC